MGLPGKAAGSMLAVVPSVVFAVAMTLSLLAWYRAWRSEETHARGLFLQESETLRRSLADAVAVRAGRIAAAARLIADGGDGAATPWRRLGEDFADIAWIPAGPRGEAPDRADREWIMAAMRTHTAAAPVLSGLLGDGAGDVALVMADATADGARVRGWLSLRFQPGALVMAARSRLPVPLAVAVRDGNSALAAVAGSTGPAPGAALVPEHVDLGAEPSFAAEEPVSVAGRTWIVGTATDSRFDDATRPGQQIVVLVLGVGFTLALWITVTVLQSNQRRFQDIAESASDWFWETNANFEFTYISERFFEITGLERADVLGRTQWDVAGPRQIAAARHVWQQHFRVMSGREAFRGLEMTLHDRNGAVRHILLSGKPSFYDNGIFRGYRGIGSDITERKAAEAEAAKKSAQLRAAIEAMPNGLIMFGEDLRLILYNRRFLELWSLTEEELEQRRYLPHLIRHIAELGRYGAGDIGQMVAERLARIVQPTIQGYELRRDDGRIIEVRSYGRSEVGYLLTYLDISDRRAGEGALRQSEERLKLALSATRAGVWDVNLTAGSRWWSPELTEMLGYAPDAIETTDATFRTLVHPEDWREVRARAKRHLAGVTPEFRAQYRLRRRDGGWTWVEDSGKAICDGNGRAVRFVGTVVDITGQRATREELMRTEKMAALGRLVAGVAHEVNTPVGLGVSVASYLDQRTQKLHALYQRGEVHQEDFEEYLDTARESCASLLANLRRAASLVGSFKRVAVDQSCERPRAFNVRSYIEEVLISLRPKLKKTRHTVTVHCPAALQFTSDPGALSQILTNLVENSLIHGFDGWDEGQITIDVREEPGVLVLVYADDGRGMSRDQQEKIFEPFFTTRLGQGGSGLGMHVVYNLVTQTLGGDIRCESEPDRGITITIRLPCTASPAGPSGIETQPTETRTEDREVPA